jgi:acylphosphatase
MSETMPPAAPPRSYATDADGGAPVIVRMRVAGTLGGSYLDFIAERAGWLSLDGWVERHGSGRAELVAAGPETLVGALEMACLLGPLDTLVHTLDVEPAPGPVSAGFVVRR